MQEENTRVLEELLMDVYQGLLIAIKKLDGSIEDNDRLFADRLEAISKKIERQKAFNLTEQELPDFIKGMEIASKELDLHRGGKGTDGILSDRLKVQVKAIKVKME